MKTFLKKLIAVSAIVVLILSAILLLIPTDKNAYLCAYNQKLDILQNTQAPRVIFIGPSTLAFGLDSKQISDSIGIPVIDMGLHIGIGARYCLEDYKTYIRKGDIVVISPSYEADFSGGGYGNKDALTDLMLATNWRHFRSLGFRQIWAVVEGIPFMCYRNLLRLIKAPIHGLNTSADNVEFKYVASGFNEFGDEVSHWEIPLHIGVDVKRPSEPLSRELQPVTVDEDFILYLKAIVSEYEQKGATVLLMPEIHSETDCFKDNPEAIEAVMNQQGLYFMTSPRNLMFDDALGYGEWGSSHLNREGVTIASSRISSLLKRSISPIASEE